MHFYFDRVELCSLSRIKTFVQSVQSLTSVQQPLAFLPAQVQDYRTKLLQAISTVEAEIFTCHCGWESRWIPVTQPPLPPSMNVDLWGEPAAPEPWWKKGKFMSAMIKKMALSDIQSHFSLTNSSWMQPSSSCDRTRLQPGIWLHLCLQLQPPTFIQPQPPESPLQHDPPPAASAACPPPHCMHPQPQIRTANCTQSSRRIKSC